MYDIMQYISAQWVEWLFAAVSIMLAASCRRINKRLNEAQQKDKAIAHGVQSLLRDSIVRNYNKYQDRGHCPIYAKESIKRAYAAYHDLGGNDVATRLYNNLLDMPEEPEPEPEEKEK